jgi:Putative peptidoglycan binding domain
MLHTRIAHVKELVAAPREAVPSSRMEGREERDPGYDDWFDEPEPPQGRSAGAVFDDEDAWVVPESGRRRLRPGRREPLVIAGREVGPTQLAIVAACVLAIFFAVLAAAGVFSSGAPKASTPPPAQNNPPPTVSSNVTTPAASSPKAQVPTTQLKPGDTGAQVKVLQKALTALGFSPGKADGDYGPSTQNAVERFQVSKGLGEDGIVGAQTLAALQHALSG